ncbi:MAG: amidophosphoribosyltransferase [Phycisphaerales bacterium JB043]
MISPPSPSIERLLHEESEKKEKCAVFGVWGGESPVRTSYFGLYAQQHRGQESAGIAASDGSTLHGHTGMGLVAEVFTPRVLWELEDRPDRRNGRHVAHPNPIVGAIGHCRYSTTGGSTNCNAQPIVESFVGGQVAIAHNGNLTNTRALKEWFEQRGHIFHTTSDTEVVLHLLASPEQQETPDPLAATLRRLQGAFSMVFLSPTKIEAARDPWGWRPLTIGRFEDGTYCVASETVGLDAVGATIVRDVEPGEIVTIDDDGLSSRRFADPAKRRAHCVFEHVYFASPASKIYGKSVQLVREQLGEALSREAPVEADLVMPMPDSGRSAATGYARASGLPYREGIVPNRYVGRTFIKPTQDERTTAVRLKLSIVSEIVSGHRLVVVDDSIVRGTTTRAKMDQLRNAGASEIHLRISCPPIKHPCFFGVDFASPEQLIAHEKNVEEIRQFLGVDSLHFLSLEGLLSCASTDVLEPEQFCTACYSGDYRIDIEHPLTVPTVEKQQMRMFS